MIQMAKKTKLILAIFSVAVYCVYLIKSRWGTPIDMFFSLPILILVIVNLCVPTSIWFNRCVNILVAVFVFCSWTVYKSVILSIAIVIGILVPACTVFNWLKIESGFSVSQIIYPYFYIKKGNWISRMITIAVVTLAFLPVASLIFIIETSGLTLTIFFFLLCLIACRVYLKTQNESERMISSKGLLSHRILLVEMCLSSVCSIGWLIYLIYVLC